MEKTIVYPSLNTGSGFISDRTDIMRELYRNFIASVKYQSNYKEIQSLNYILSEDTIELDEKSELISSSVEKLYKDYYDKVECEVVTKNENNNIIFIIKIVAVYQGATYELSDLVKSKDHVTLEELETRFELYRR